MTGNSNASIPEKVSRRLPLAVPQETLVNDARAGLTPSQMVERKLVALLRSTLLPASHLQASILRRALS
jgi:hypothetical protein